MLRIQRDINQWYAQVHLLAREIGREDVDLARQLRRSATSVGTNVAEGVGARGLLRRKAYRIALAEMRESMGAIDMALAAEIVAPLPADEADRMQKIVATLVNLAKPWEA